MDKLVEQQREHFNKISGQYFSARSNANHQLIKQLIWQRFFARHKFRANQVQRVLEPMCGMAEGYRILRINLNSSFDYDGFDYSESMVKYAKSQQPQLRIEHGDVTSYHPEGEAYDMIILVGGLHHVFSRTQEVLVNLGKALRPGGYFLSFEPTHDNWVSRRIRQRIYTSNDLFDADTEQGFEYRDLERYFNNAGYEKLDEIYPGLLAYIMYYNPDAFPSLNIGGETLVRSIFAIDRIFWTSWLGRKLSFATLGLWKRK